MRPLARHILVELYGCPAAVLDDLATIEREMVAAAQAAGATVIQACFHRFAPVGVSGVVVIQESHLAIHTWPEHGYAAIDLFTCGAGVDPWVPYERLHGALQAEHGSALEVRRGALLDKGGREAGRPGDRGEPGRSR